MNKLQKYLILIDSIKFLKKVLKYLMEMILMIHTSFLIVKWVEVEQQGIIYSKIVVIYFLYKE
jgi:hypothetical protein